MTEPVTRQNCGGNLVTQIAHLGTAQTFATTPYVCRLVRVEPGTPVMDGGLLSRIVVVQAVDPGASLTLDGFEGTLGLRDSYQLEGYDTITLNAEGGAVTVLIGGVEDAVFTESSATLVRDADHYKVTKPWGYEVWCTGDHPAYCFKEILLRAGQRSSLQYHRVKRETTILFSGQYALVYQANPAAPIDAVSEADLGRVLLDPVSVVNVMPNTLHRVEPITDVLIYEISTPFPDDVVRVQDDKARGNGRVQSEHQG